MKAEESIFQTFHCVHQREYDASGLAACCVSSAQNMFQVESVNCICVDWKGGSRATYTQASQNVRVVGAEVAYLANTLQVTDSASRTSPGTLVFAFSLQDKICRCNN